MASNHKRSRAGKWSTQNLSTDALRPMKDTVNSGSFKPSYLFVEKAKRPGALKSGANVF